MHAAYTFVQYDNPEWEYLNTNITKGEKFYDVSIDEIEAFMKKVKECNL